MITDLLKASGTVELSGEVCVIGTGPAGLTIAMELAAKGKDVILLEAGGEHYEDETQALYDGRVVGHQNIDVAASRLRQFGGTSGHWTGMCAPLDPVDFEPRADMPLHGWPITRAQLDPFYVRAQPYLDLGPFKYRWEDWADRATGPRLNLDPSKVITCIYQQSPPTRFALKYIDRVRAEPRIRCWLHANVTDIRLNEAGTAVDAVQARTLGGRAATVRARAFVLACGGVENPRILLNCVSQRPAGLGNENDLVGRYYTDHMTIETGNVVLNGGVSDALYTEPVDFGDAKVHFGLKIRPEVVLERGLNNNSAFLVPHYEAEVFNDDFRNYGWIAFSETLKAFSRGQAPDRFSERYCDIVDDIDKVAIGSYRHVMRKILPKTPVVAYKLRQDAEQAPNPDSRVTLTDEVDALGMRRVALDWRIASDDLLRLRATHQYLGEQLGAAGLGRLQLGIGDPPDASIAYSGYHHMGTTRMHADPKRGVVDADCRLHSVGNLYVGGSSIFTTGGCANPTLTITALAIRLADHLASVVA